MSRSVDEVAQALIRRLPSPESRRAYQRDWATFLVWLTLDGVEVTACRPSHVEAYTVHLREKGRQKSTTGRALSVIREMFGALVREELMASNPAREVKNPKISSDPRTPFLTEAHVRQLLLAPCDTWREYRDRLCAGLLFGLGWRRQEIARLRVEDFRDGTVTGILKGAKPATVGVPPWLQEWIAEWRAYAGIESGALLPRWPHDLRPVSGDMVYNAVHRRALRAGLPFQSVNPHALRRTLITQGRARGVDLKAMQLAVGHASQSTTEHYDRAREAAANAPGQVFADLVAAAKEEPVK